MASTLVSTLYPPLVDTFMPAFLQTEPAKINFSISPYNVSTKIQFVHVSLVDLASNESVLTQRYPREDSVKTVSNVATYTSATAQDPKIVNSILIIPFSAIPYDKNTETYTLEISPELLRKTDANNSYFANNKYYKAQLRFDMGNEYNSYLTEDGKNIKAAYLIDGRPYFSEWSSVCLIKPIAQPVMTIAGFERAEEEGSAFVRSFTQGTILVSGGLTFNFIEGAPKEENERFASYEAWLYDGEEIIDYTGKLLPSNNITESAIDCMLNADTTVPGKSYRIVIKATTNNHYEITKEYPVSIEEYEGDYVFNPKVELTEDMEEGRVFIHVTIDDSELTETPPAPGRLYIRRASSIDNFKTWEILAAIDQESSDTVDVTVVDSTVGSLTSYQYAVQYQFFKGTWSSTTYSDIIYPTFYDMLLSRGDTQLAIRYNSQLSNMKPVVNRAKLDTLGSKYPKFAENAQLNYKQYSISGLISAEGDFNRAFMSEYDVRYATDMAEYAKQFGENYMLRNDSLPENADDFLIREHDKYPHENWYWERQFREEVVQWLNDGEAKLFRSMPEGNMIVMITDISLTPNQNIGRMLYNFSATMYEIGDGYSLKTLDAANIIDTPDIFAQELNLKSEIAQKKISALRQFRVDITGSENNLFDLFETIIRKEYDGVRKDKTVVDNSLTISRVRLEFLSKPQYWTQDGTAITNAVDDLSKICHFGYAFKLNGSIFFVNSNGIYHFPKDIDIKNLYILGNHSLLVTGIVSYAEEIKTSLMPTLVYKEKSIVGQHSGVMLCDEWLANEIKSKYEINIYEGATINQKLKRLSSISFDVSPYSVIDILFDDMQEPTNITIGRTGVYSLSPECYINDFCFRGRKMFYRDDNPNFLEPWEFTMGDTPERNTVYEKNGEYVILYNNKEYPFEFIQEDVGIAKIPIEGYVTYTGETVRSEYN